MCCIVFALSRDGILTFKLYEIVFNVLIKHAYTLGVGSGSRTKVWGDRVEYCLSIKKYYLMIKSDGRVI